MVAARSLNAFRQIAHDRELRGLVGLLARSRQRLPACFYAIVAVNWNLPESYQMTAPTRTALTRRVGCRIKVVALKIGSRRHLPSRRVT
jgi:hypothetical protein